MTERILGAARLSNRTEESVSIESQKGDIRGVADYRKSGLVHVAIDDGVSGGLSPFEREGLGPWLSDPEKLAQWDTLAVAKLDRLTRSLLHFAGLIQWAEANGKNIVSRAESIDLSTPAGRMVAQILILFAEFERARMAERQTSNKKYRREAGAWGTGRPPFGYAVERRGALLYLSQASSPVVSDLNRVAWSEHGMWVEGAQKLSTGASAASVATWLSQMTGGKWDASHVTRTYRNPVYRGYMVRQRVTGKDASGKVTHARWDKDVVLDEEGMPVTHDAPMVDAEGWRELQAALDKASVPRSHNGEVRELSGLVTCAECGQTLMYAGQWTRGEFMPRYRHKGTCPKGGMRTIDALAVEEQFTGDFLGAHGARKMTAREVHGEDHSAAIRELQERLAEIEDALARPGAPVEVLARTYKRVEADLESLRARSGVTTRTVELDVTLGQVWESYSAEERNRFLRAKGVAVLARSEGRGKTRVRVEHGDLPTLLAFERQSGWGE